MYKERVAEWLAFDENTKAELLAISDEKELEDRFYKNVSFGTGGLRGLMGAGTNRMNSYTVKKASISHTWCWNKRFILHHFFKKLLLFLI